MRLLNAQLRATVLEVEALGFIQRFGANQRQVLYSTASLVSSKRKSLLTSLSGRMLGK